jgi:hypothetical protein
VEWVKNKGEILQNKLVMDTILKTKPIGFEVPHVEEKDFPV